MGLEEQQDLLPSKQAGTARVASLCVRREAGRLDGLGGLLDQAGAHFLLSQDLGQGRGQTLHLETCPGARSRGPLASPQPFGLTTALRPHHGLAGPGSSPGPSLSAV